VKIVSFDTFCLGISLVLRCSFEVFFHSHVFLLASLSFDIFVPANKFILCTTKLHNSFLYNKACTKYFPVLLRTIQSLHKVLPSTTSYYKACTEFPSTTSCVSILTSVTLTRQFHCDLPCKAQKNCLNQDCKHKQHGSSHSNANCTPGSPNAMAQNTLHIQSFKDNLRAALTMGTTRAPNEVELRPSHKGVALC